MYDSVRKKINENQNFLLYNFIFQFFVSSSSIAKKKNLRAHNPKIFLIFKPEHLELALSEQH